MAFCQNCGAENAEAARFCEKCGKAVSAARSQQPVVKADYTPPAPPTPPIQRPAQPPSPSPSPSGSAIPTWAVWFIRALPLFALVGLEYIVSPVFSIAGIIVNYASYKNNRKTIDLVCAGASALTLIIFVVWLLA